MFVLKDGSKMVEEDSWEHGCLPETAFNVDYDVTFKGETPADILAKVKEHFDVTDEDMLVNSCGEHGRLDVQILENKDAYTASKHEIDEWMAGRIKLYLCTYTFTLYHMETASFETEGE